jgi:hypothetical protein
MTVTIGHRGKRESAVTWRGVSYTIVALAMVMTVSCDSSGPSDGAPGDAPAYGVFSGSLTLAGEVALKGTFADRFTSRHRTCATYAQGIVGGTREFVVPSPDGSALVDGHTVTYTAGLAGNTPNTDYRGPGTYAEPVAVVSDLVVDNAGFLPGDGARTTLTIAADGSGSLLFTDMIDIASNALEHGTARWTCTG